MVFLLKDGSYICNMGKPLISILTPFKNTAQFLPECLDSILTQSYDNWELLLVDDSLSIRKIVGMFLSKAGYDVEVATDGVDAIEKLENASFDLIVTDLEMPRMHGYELIAEVRHQANLKNVPIIVLTSRAGEKHQQKAIELGANDYIIKPVDEETLLESVKKLLAR